MGRYKNLEEVEYDRGFAAMRDHRHAEAERRFTKALQIHPGLHEALEWRAWVRKERGRLKEAAADFRSSLARFPRCRWCLEVAACVQTLMDRPGAALKLWDRAIRIDPRNVDSRYLRGMVRLSLDRRRAAIADFTRIISNRSIGSLALVGRGQAKALEGDLCGSLADFDRAIKRRPGDRQSLFYRGLVRFLTKDIAGARDDLKATGLGKAQIVRLTRSTRLFSKWLQSGKAGDWLTARS